VALAAALTSPLAAQDVTFRGQVRPRYEYRDPAGGGKDEFTSMRVRAALAAKLDEHVAVFIQLQDVRLFGEETSTLADFSADHFDLHQGYLRFTGRRLDWMTTTVGRQEVNFGGQRLVGAVGWTQQGRAFDGVRLDAGTGWGSLAFIGFKLAEETAPKIANDMELYGAYATVRNTGPGALDLYWLYDRTEGSVDTNEHTFGARYAFKGVVNGRVEGSFQAGTRAAQDLSAFMFGARLGRTFAGGRAGVTLWYDYLSGDDDLADGKAKVFNTLFATNHKFYGFADLFLNIPVHTGGFGLQDLAVKLHWKPADGISVGADYHSFRAAESNALAEAHFGDELDLTLSHAYTSHLTVVTGLSFVFQDKGFAEIGRLSEDMTWGYVMLNAHF